MTPVKFGGFHPIPKGAYGIFAVLTIDIYFHQASSRFWKGNKVI